ncbi:MAG: NPCBM/NEW2 domain-containing protein [Planctomycetes bacterium]|nr:NPCBM/NEW2 domain-containing protein [Planctomycetota bacterium]
MGQALYFLVAGLLFWASSGLASETVWLSSLDLGKTRQGWGKPQASRSVTEKPISIAGRKFDQGIGTHAPSVLYIDLSAGSERFLGAVGVDDAVLQQPASVAFKVIGDGKTLWQSGVMKAGDPARTVDLDVTGLKTLVLVVSDGGDGMNFDHADWAEARLIARPGLARPQTADPPREEAVILTPKPPREPRLNGARVFGVRPGSPFLFTIPATGERPMTFAADHLPEGLAVDAGTGQITGVVRQKGEHSVTLRARNALGEASRPFKIVCGDTLALTPHMGWNSWYVWENHVTDRILRQAADAMVSSGLIDHGYMYVNIDDCWSVKPGSTDPSLGGAPRDAQGKVNANQRFPDMKALTGYIHSKGLKAGIYISPGPLTCAGHAGSYQHEEQDARRFAEWDFDFLKYDWCSYGQIAKDQSREELQKPYRLMSGILSQLDRDMVFNLCQYGMGNVWEWGREVGGNSWRTAGDLGLSFEGIPAALFRDGFGNNGRERWAGPGGWNDPDYLLLGFLSNWKGGTAPTPLTPNEQYTHVSLWCLLAAPLIFSGDITRMDEFTLSLLTNDEVLEVDQDPLGKAGRRVAAEDDLEVWAKDMEDGSKAVGLFNRGEMEAAVAARWGDLGVEGKQRVRDLWRQKDLGVFEGQFQAPVLRHGVVLVRLSKN